MYDLDTIKHRLAEEKRARKQADSQLVEHANELAKVRKRLGEMTGMIAGIPYPVILFDKSGTVTFANPSSIRYWGRGVVPGASVLDVFSFIKDLDFAGLIDGEGILQLKARKKGEYFSFIFRGDPRQKVCYLYCHDISEYEREKFEIQKASQESEEILTSLPSVLIGIDQSGRVMLWNKTAELLFERAEFDVLGMHVSEIDINWDKHRIEELITACQENAAFYEDKLMLTRDDGQERRLDLVCTPVAQQFNRRAGVFLLVKDITNLPDNSITDQSGDELSAVIEMVTFLAQEMSIPIGQISENLRSLDEAVASIRDVLEVNMLLLDEKENEQTLQKRMLELEKVVHSSKIEQVISTLPATVGSTIEMIGKVSELLKNAEVAEKQTHTS